jgi:hypothetical protein
MPLYCSYTKDEVLEIIAKHASQTLPKKDGIMKVRIMEDDSIEIEFIEDEIEQKDLSTKSKLELN